MVLPNLSTKLLFQHVKEYQRPPNNYKSLKKTASGDRAKWFIQYPFLEPSDSLIKSLHLSVWGVDLCSQITLKEACWSATTFCLGRQSGTVRWVGYLHKVSRVFCDHSVSATKFFKDKFLNTGFLNEWIQVIIQKLFHR